MGDDELQAPISAERLEKGGIVGGWAELVGACKEVLDGTPYKTVSGAGCSENTMKVAQGETDLEMWETNATRLEWCIEDGFWGCPGDM